MKLLLTFIFLSAGISAYSNSLDSIGIDTSAYLNSHEIQFLDSIFDQRENKPSESDVRWTKPELIVKKVVFVHGSSGTIVVTKVAFFDDLKKMEGEAINYMFLSEEQTKQTGGYEMIISNWAKYINVKSVVETLSKGQENLR